MLRIAIDPGQSGGIAWAETPGRPACIPMPDTLHDIVEVIARISGPALCAPKGVTAYIEQVPKFVRAIPGSAVAVMFRNYGILLGACAALGLRIVEIPPQKWQKALGLGTSAGMTRTQWKNKLKGKAQALSPGTRVTLATSDALLILQAGFLLEP